MKFNAKISEFQRAISKTLPAMPRKSTLPILEHLKFTLENDKLKIIATDQDITIMSTINVNAEESGMILVPGKKLSDITKALGEEGEFEFVTDEETYEIKIKTSFGEYGMKGLSTEEYLNLPELFNSEKPSLDDNEKTDEKSETAYFSKRQMIFLADKTVFAVSNDEYRPAMTGVFFQFRGSYVISVATDSFRLVKATVKPEESKLPDNLDIIIPARAVDLLRKVDSEVIMSVIKTMEKITHVRFDTDDTVFITRIINEKFPPYETVIPKEFKNEVTVDRHELLSAIKRVSIFTSTISNQVRLSFHSSLLTISGEDEDFGTQASETIKCDFDGEDLTMGFNFRYIEDALSNIDIIGDDQSIYISFTEPNRPAIIKPKTSEDLLMLIMPVRL